MDRTPPPQSLRSGDAQNPGGFAHIAALDGVRGLAILLVLYCHLFSANPISGSRIFNFLSELRASSYVGVDLFFALSGFLITGILQDTLHLPDFFKNFYARRTLRIFPLYFPHSPPPFCLVRLAIFLPHLHLEPGALALPATHTPRLQYHSFLVPSSRGAVLSCLAISRVSRKAGSKPHQDLVDRMSGHTPHSCCTGLPAVSLPQNLSPLFADLLLRGQPPLRLLSLRSPAHLRPTARA